MRHKGKLENIILYFKLNFRLKKSCEGPRVEDFSTNTHVPQKRKKNHVEKSFEEFKELERTLCNGEKVNRI